MVGVAVTIGKDDTMQYLSGAVSPGWLDASGRTDVGILVQPDTQKYVRHAHLFGPMGVDNGCFNKGASFDAQAWWSWLSTLRSADVLFAVAPDVVGDAVATLRRSQPWLERIRGLGMAPAFVAQDGSELLDWEAIWPQIGCLFIGGTDTFKLGDYAQHLIAQAKRRDIWTHVGRVNSRRRLRWCAQAGADSADGTYIAFGPDVNTPRMLRWLDELSTAQGVLV